MQDATTHTPDDDALFRQALRDLVALGTDLARDLVAAHKDGTLAPKDAADAFERTARTVRRTILLATSLGKPRTTHASRRAVIRAVEDAISTDEVHTEPAERHALEREFRDRLDSPELVEDLDALPVAEVIETIKRDLDLGRATFMRVQRRRRTPAEVAALHALARGEPVPPPSPALHEAPASVFPPGLHMDDLSARHLWVGAAGTARPPHRRE